MSVATKTARSLQASATNTAGSTATGTAVNLTTALGALVTARITNGATGPTLPCAFTLQVSNDNSVWRDYSTQTAGTANSAVYDFTVNLPVPTMYVRSVFTGNTAQSVTIESLAHELTSIS